MSNAKKEAGPESGEIAPGTIDAIVGGYSSNPFGILGPHANGSGRTGWTVRAFLPQAESADVLLANGTAVPMERRHKEGFFVADLAGSQTSYQLRLKNWQGISTLIEDPYRFWPIMTGFDLHL